MAEIARLFSAVVWSDAQRAPLCELQDTLRQIHADAPLRWTPAADLHLTLRFYGNVTSAQERYLARQAAMLAAECAPSELTFTGFEVWPTGRPRMIVACFRAARSLLGLQLGLEKQACDSGLEAETRPFRPHVTLARAGASWDGAMAKVKLAPFRVPAETIGFLHRASSGANRYAELTRLSLQTK